MNKLVKNMVEQLHLDQVHDGFEGFSQSVDELEKIAKLYNRYYQFFKDEVENQVDHIVLTRTAFTNLKEHLDRVNGDSSGRYEDHFNKVVDELGDGQNMVFEMLSTDYERKFVFDKKFKDQLMSGWSFEKFKEEYKFK